MYGNEQPARKITLDWLRHGEPEGGVQYRGSLDDPLSQKGWQQMRDCQHKAQQAGTRWAAVISSPMQRCQAFAQEVATRHQIPLTVLPELRELCFGELEGMTPQAAWARYPELLRNLWQAPQLHTPPGGELYNDFSARVQHAITAMLQQFRDEHVLVVAHGGVIRAMLSACFHFTPRDTFAIEIPYAGLTRVKAYPQSNATTHFALEFINGFAGH